MIPAPTPHLSMIRTRAAGRPGFTLSEVLVAIGILALGTVAVASLFPTAAFMQKEAVKETLQQNHIRSADAILEGIGLRNETLLEMVELIETRPVGYPAYDVRATIDEPAYDVFALAEMDLQINSSYDGAAYTAPTSNIGDTPDMRMGPGAFAAGDFDDSYVYDTTRYAFGNIPISMRSLPTTLPNNALTGYAEREVFWVPLVRPGLEASELFPDWNVYVFILQPESQLRNAGVYTLNTADPDYGYGDFNLDTIVCANPDPADYVPKVFRIPVIWNDADPNIARPDFDNNGTADVNLFGYVKPGEKVLGDNGIIYRVSQIDGGSGAMILSEETDYTPINRRDLGALWVAPAPGGFNQDSPLADIRLLSNTVVRTNDF